MSDLRIGLINTMDLLKSPKQYLVPVIVAAFWVVVQPSVSAQAQEDLVRNNAEIFLKERMHDPSSYEFVKIEIIDSVTIDDNIQYRKRYFSRQMEQDQRFLETEEGYKTELLPLYDENHVAELNAKIERSQQILSKIDSLATVLEDRKSEVVSYTYIFTARANNRFGARNIEQYFLQTGPAPYFEIINMTNERNKIFLNPNDFPGYREMIEEYF